MLLDGGGYLVQDITGRRLLERLRSVGCFMPKSEFDSRCGQKWHWHSVNKTESILASPHHPMVGNCYIFKGYITYLRAIRRFSFECLLFELVQLLL